MNDFNKLLECMSISKSRKTESASDKEFKYKVIKLPASQISKIKKLFSRNNIEITRTETSYMVGGENDPSGAGYTWTNLEDALRECNPYKNPDEDILEDIYAADYEEIVNNFKEIAEDFSDENGNLMIYEVTSFYTDSSLPDDFEDELPEGVLVEIEDSGREEIMISVLKEE